MPESSRNSGWKGGGGLDREGCCLPWSFDDGFNATTREVGGWQSEERCPGRSSRPTSARSTSDGAMAKTASLPVLPCEQCQLTCFAPLAWRLPAVLGAKKQTWQAD